MSQDRKKLEFMAELSQQTDRFEEMAENMAQMVKLEQPLSNEERNLFSIAFRNTIGSLRSAWRVLQNKRTSAVESDA